MRCPIHPHRELTCAACLGAKGGRSKSAKKVAAVRKNGLKNKGKSVQEAAEEVMRVADKIINTVKP